MSNENTLENVSFSKHHKHNVLQQNFSELISASSDSIFVSELMNLPDEEGKVSTSVNFHCCIPVKVETWNGVLGKALRCRAATAAAGPE